MHKFTVHSDFWSQGRDLMFSKIPRINQILIKEYLNAVNISEGMKASSSSSWLQVGTFIRFIVVTTGYKYMWNFTLCTRREFFNENLIKVLENSSELSILSEWVSESDVHLAPNWEFIDFCSFSTPPPTCISEKESWLSCESVCILLYWNLFHFIAF